MALQCASSQGWRWEGKAAEAGHVTEGARGKQHFPPAVVQQQQGEKARRRTRSYQCECVWGTHVSVCKTFQSGVNDRTEEQQGEKENKLQWQYGTTDTQKRGRKQTRYEMEM
eukprot:EG_transcript_31144